MWKSIVDGRVLHFELFGINNQNFIMRDVETGTWWQQVSGEAIQGPLKGRQLELVPWDEVSFTVWRREHPDSLVLLPDEDHEANYLEPDWARYAQSYPTVVEVDPDAGLKPRDLVVGVALAGAAKAYPWQRLLRESPVNDEVGGRPIVLVMAEDNRSVRVFERRSGTPGGDPPEFFRKATLDPQAPLVLIDAATGSEWDFAGRATAGELAGSELPRIQELKEFWFDWQLYNPQTEVYAAGL